MLHGYCTAGPHVDSIKFSGGFISGLSLRSARIMELTYSTEDSCDMHSSSAMQGTGTIKTAPNKYAPVNGSAGQLHNYSVSPDGLEFTYASERSADAPETAPTIVPTHLLGAYQLFPLPQRLEIVVPPRSLYILQGAWRYKYNHAIFGAEQAPSLVPPLTTPIAQRASIIFRDKKKFNV